MMGCQSTSEKQELSSAEALINVDKAFCKMAIDSGLEEAFASFADQKAVILRNGEYALEGVVAIGQSYQAFDTLFVYPPRLLWMPVKAEIARSGDLGYTYGNYEFITMDSLQKESKTYGNYVTIWKRQADGSWKYVLDGGVSTPPQKVVVKWWQLIDTI